MADSPLRVLLVEDDDVFATYARNVLERTGLDLTVDHVTTLGAALIALACDRYDVTILDMRLPDAQGTDTVERVMTAPVVPPIVVLTGMVDEPSRLAAFEHGVQEYMDKSELASGRAASAMRDMLLRAVARGRGFQSRHLALAKIMSRKDDDGEQ